MNRKIFQKLLLLCMMSFIGQMSFAQTPFHCSVPTIDGVLPDPLPRINQELEYSCKVFKVHISILRSSENEGLDVEADIEIMKENMRSFYEPHNIYFVFEETDPVKDDTYYQSFDHEDNPDFYDSTPYSFSATAPYNPYFNNLFNDSKYMKAFYDQYGHKDENGENDAIEIIVHTNPDFIIKKTKWLTPEFYDPDDHTEINTWPYEVDDLNYYESNDDMSRALGAGRLYEIDKNLPNGFYPCIYIRAKYNERLPLLDEDVIIHELGHTLNLYHTFEAIVTPPECAEGSSIPYSGENCLIGGDRVCDTPVDRSGGNGYKNFITDCTLSLPASYISNYESLTGCDLSENYNPSLTNIMSYYPSECRTEFTPGQWERIFYTLEVVQPVEFESAYIGKEDCRNFCNSTFYDHNEYLISENTNWASSNIPTTGLSGAPSGTIRISQELRIESGKSLVLANDVTIEMGENAKIIVERGALLQVNGATITKACDKFWSGIEVWGDGTDLSQSTAYQGKIDLNSGTTIEFAKDAITTSRYINGERDFTSFGGIVDVYKATFKNCRRAVEFMSYQRAPHPVTGIEQNNKSKFEECNFIVDNNYPDELGASEQITMWNTKGIRILGCNFSSTNIALAIDPEFKAIHTEDATYTVKNTGLSGSAVSNSFTGFYTGIFSSMSRSKIHSIVIENSHFNNKRGIIMEGAYRPRVTENHFSADHVGVYFDHCISYKMEDNSFDDNGSNGRSYGLVIRQSGNQANSAYNNEFDGLYVATQAQGGNRGVFDDADSGLKYTCNDYQASNYDMSIIPIDATSPFQGISATQGNNDKSATNGFIDTVSGLSADNDIQNGAGHVTYFYFGDEVASNTSYPADITSATVTHSLSETQNDCISSFTHGTSVGDLTGLLNTVKGEIEGGKATLHAMIDGGDTETLTEEVIYSTYSEAAELYYELMSKSPALSIEVMMKAIEKEYDLPQILLKQILEANPHAAKSREIQEKLNNRLLPLPEYMREQINAGLNIVTAKENLEASLSSNYAELARIYNELLYRYSDGADESASDFVTLLTSIENPHYRYQLAMYYLEVGNPALARNTFENIPTDFELSRATTLEYQDWVGYMGLLLDVAQSQRNFTNLTANEVASLTTIADSHSYSAGQARALLRQIVAVDYEYPLYDPADQTWNHARKASVTPIETPIFGLYPNPANDLVTIELKEGMELIAKNISIYDITGRMMDQITWETYNTETTIDLRKYLSGIYIVKITGKNQEALASQLLIIQ